MDVNLTVVRSLVRGLYVGITHQIPMTIPQEEIDLIEFDSIVVILDGVVESQKIADLEQGETVQDYINDSTLVEECELYALYQHDDGFYLHVKLVK